MPLQLRDRKNIPLPQMGYYDCGAWLHGPHSPIETRLYTTGVSYRMPNLIILDQILSNLAWA